MKISREMWLVSTSLLYALAEVLVYIYLGKESMWGVVIQIIWVWLLALPLFSSRFAQFLKDGFK